jgi:hypothetical protein
LIKFVIRSNIFLILNKTKDVRIEYNYEGWEKRERGGRGGEGKGRREAILIIFPTKIRVLIIFNSNPFAIRLNDIEN